MTLIHSTAIVDPQAELDPTVGVGPYAVIGPHVRVGAGTTIGAHCVIEGRTTIGRDNRIFQFVSLGAHAMLGFASAVTQDVPPFMLVDGNPLAVRGFNVVGLRRREFSPARIAAVKQMHRLLYRQGRTLDEARTAIEALAAETPEAAPDVAMMSEFLAGATRGIAR